MKSTLCILISLLAITNGNAQSVLLIGSGTTLKTSDGVAINFNDMGLENNGTLNQAQGDGNFKFTGKKDVSIGGSKPITIAILKINKSSTAKVLLGSNIKINSTVIFTSGLLDLNNKNMTLTSSASISGETEATRIIGPLGGEVIITRNMNQPNAVNAGNLGAIITSACDLGSVTIRRGHKVQSGTGMPGSIARYYSIVPTISQSSTIRFNYFDAELNGQTEDQLKFFQSADNGVSWSNQSFSSRDVAANWVEKTGLTSFQLLTLSSSVSSPLYAKVSTEAARKDNMTIKKIVVGPNPNNGNFWFVINGIDKETNVSLFTIDGKLVKQFQAYNLQRTQVDGMPNGVYLLKGPGLAAFKVIVAGSSVVSSGTTMVSSQ